MNFSAITRSFPPLLPFLHVLIHSIFRDQSSTVRMLAFTTKHLIKSQSFGIVNGLMQTLFLVTVISASRLSVLLQFYRFLHAASLCMDRATVPFMCMTPLCHYSSQTVGNLLLHCLTLYDLPLTLLSGLISVESTI